MTDLELNLNPDLAVAEPRRSKPGLPGLRNAATVGLTVVLVVLLLGLAAPLLARYDPLAQGPDALAGSGPQHWLGTDEFGRDIASRVLYGIRTDLLVSAVATPAGALAGIALGLLCGVHRALDLVLQRAFDVMLAFTALILGVTVAALIGPGTTAVIWTVAGATAPVFGRLTRDAVRSQRDRDYVTASAAIGAGRARLLLRHILPNGADPLIVQGALALSEAVFIEGAMSFTGIGVRPPTPSLGSLLHDSINYMSENPGYALGPMAVITALVLGWNLLADGLTKGLRRR